MSPRSSIANVDFVFVAPEKKRPWAAFSEVAAKAQFTVDRLDPEMIYARMMDDTGELPPVDTRILRCSDALQLIRYNAADMALGAIR